MASKIRYNFLTIEFSGTLSMSVIKQLVLVLSILLLAQISAAQKMLKPKENFLYDGKYFDPYSPYVILGAGYGVNMKQKEGEQNLAADFHFQFKEVAFNVGYFSSANRFLAGKGLRKYPSNQKLHDFHFGAGWRYERFRHNFAIYAGPSYAAGRVPIDTLSSAAFIIRRTPGVYLQTHYSYKSAYDVGFGVSLYVAMSRYYKIIGIQTHIFLSSAFKAFNR